SELPAKSVDLAAINLTELVNSMLNTALRGTKKLFSLLSVTSYSSFAFHKVSVTIYNISNVKNVDPGKFPMHYCYCLNNVTNDLTDFTALLVDIVGNSTSYLTEIFKSTSILSVRQSNDSDCIYICVMTGQTGRNLSDFWEMLEKSPVINYTFSSNTSSDLGKYSLGNKRKQQQHFMKLQEDPNKTVDLSAEHAWTFKSEQPLSDLNAQPDPLQLLGRAWPHRQPCSPAPVSMARRTDTCFILLVHVRHVNLEMQLHCLRGLYSAGKAGLSTHGQSLLLVTQMEKTADNHIAAAFALHVWALFTPAGACGGGHPHHAKCAPLTVWSLVVFSEPQHGICSIARNLMGQVFELVQSCIFFLGCPQAVLKESRVTSPPVTLIVQKISPCVMELCRFFQLCLCVGQRRYSRKEAMRYCVEYYSWFLKNASYVCERVKRVAYSHTLKQKCLKNICMSV
ncbi:HHLA1 protein, partial [Herpetotheres cachinnans]|nr:HHLA1 protein [Herpetotheres cachinnans]